MYGVLPCTWGLNTETAAVLEYISRACLNYICIMAAWTYVVDDLYEASCVHEHSPAILHAKLTSQ